MFLCDSISSLAQWKSGILFKDNMETTKLLKQLLLLNAAGKNSFSAVKSAI